MMKTKAEKLKKGKTGVTDDLTDSSADREKLEPDTATIDLPDVEDIPGQEYIKPPTLESFVDDTASSADEEGPVRKKNKETSNEKVDPEVIFKEEDEGLNDSTDSEDYNLRRAALDNTDDEGDPLNEEGFGEDVSGKDLDIPGAADDDEDEDIGEEDEENNSWSLEGEQEDNETSKFE